MSAAAEQSLDIKTPRWAVPLLDHYRYKGAKGGRSAGKSHFFAERLVEECFIYPDLSAVCIREIQRSLKFSAKRLIEAKIEQFGLQSHFEIQRGEIHRNGGRGVILFEGMQDHTADSIRSLEDFDRAWVEEAHSLSAYSLSLLLPTIRKDGSEIWFSWNPHHADDPVDRLMAGDQYDPAESCTVHVTYRDNPFITNEAVREANRHLRRDPDTFDHVWLGDYIEISEAIIFSGKWRMDRFDVPEDAHGPYFGADWGFAQDPTVLVRLYISADMRTLYIDNEASGVGIELDDTPALFDSISGARDHLIHADNARPETIAHMKRKGFRVTGAKKWSGSVEDGVAFLKSFDEIVIHERCSLAIQEARHYSYKVDRLTGDIRPQIADAYNHVWDAARYALERLIRQRGAPMIGRA